MTNDLTTANGISHSATLTSLSSGNTYNYYVRCSDVSGNPNTSDYEISFRVSNGSAKTCSLADVQAEINLALVGETVSVPAGNCTSPVQ